jgi:fumarate hydratase class II
LFGIRKRGKQQPLGAPLAGDEAERKGRSEPRIAVALREAALRLNAVTPEDFDAWVRPEAMLRPAG